MKAKTHGHEREYQLLRNPRPGTRARPTTAAGRRCTENTPTSRHKGLLPPRTGAPPPLRDSRRFSTELLKIATTKETSTYIRQRGRKTRQRPRLSTAGGHSRQTPEHRAIPYFATRKACSLQYTYDAPLTSPLRSSASENRAKHLPLTSCSSLPAAGAQECSPRSCTQSHRSLLR